LHQTAPRFMTQELDLN